MLQNVWARRGIDGERPRKSWHVNSAKHSSVKSKPRRPYGMKSTIYPKCMILITRLIWIWDYGIEIEEREKFILEEALNFNMAEYEQKWISRWRETNENCVDRRVLRTSSQLCFWSWVPQVGECFNWRVLHFNGDLWVIWLNSEYKNDKDSN